MSAEQPVQPSIAGRLDLKVFVMSDGTIHLTVNVAPPPDDRGPLHRATPSLAKVAGLARLIDSLLPAAQQRLCLAWLDAAETRIEVHELVDANVEAAAEADRGPDR